MNTDSESALTEPQGVWIGARPTRLREVLQRMVRLPWVVSEHWDLVRTTLRRDLVARFQGTLLGWAWPVLQPLLLFGIYFFIFTELLQQRLQGLPDSQRGAMAVYMFCAMISWSSMADALARGTNVIVENGNLIKKLVFPAELLPLNVVLSALVMMLFGVGIFVLATAFTPLWPVPGLTLLWVPLIVVVQGLFAYGIVLFLSTMQVFLRDTAQIVGMATTVWMLLTPVFWAPELMGENMERYLPMIHANPAYHMVSAWRGALMGDLVVHIGERVMHPVSVAAIPTHLGVLALWALGAYALGYTFFVLSQRRFADEV
jgi:ABC-type polysaccharide/polyol phosphate export permease